MEEQPMKLIHQHQLKVNMMHDHKWIIKLILIILGNVSSITMSANRMLCNTDIQPDSISAIYVFSIDPNTYTAVNVSKEYFLSNYINSGKSYNAIIKNRNTIQGFINLFNMLQETSDYNMMNTNQFYYQPIVSKSGQLFLMNRYPLDIRSLVVMERSGVYYPIWISSTYVESDGRFYLNSDALRKWLTEVCLP
jgi:hypothetical protein